MIEHSVLGLVEGRTADTGGSGGPAQCQVGPTPPHVPSYQQSHEETVSWFQDSGYAKAFAVE